MNWDYDYDYDSDRITADKARKCWDAYEQRLAKSHQKRSFFDNSAERQRKRAEIQEKRNDDWLNFFQNYCA
ncbi:MAG: hypothetical protein GC191_03560 [Azospirillum sp.]|nr:hypothetical protein [Azospirillum sp.]